MSTVTLTPGDNGASVDVQPGEEIVIELPETPTTGFEWAVVPTHEPLLSLVRTASALGSGAQGAPSVRAFTFQANINGDGRIELKNWRAWEGESSVRSRFTVNVHIR